MVNILLEIIGVSVTKKIRIYIAGPMRGIENCNYPAFYKVEELLDSQKCYEVVNPARMDDEEGIGQQSEYKEALKRDIDEIFEVDAMYMMRGWEKSEGARVEHALAVYLGLYIQYE
jgi:hypothetical protein